MTRPRLSAPLAAALLAAGLAGLLVAAACSHKEPQAKPQTIVVKAGEPAAPVGPAGHQAAPKQAQAAAPAPTHKVGESVLYGPGDYLETTVGALPYAKRTLATANLENTLKAYQASEGHWPASLDELAKWLGQPVPPAPQGMKYDYDPKTGAVKVVPVE
jgi:outer membrane biosynthesis protein TonB